MKILPILLIVLAGCATIPAPKTESVERFQFSQKECEGVDILLARTYGAAASGVPVEIVVEAIRNMLSGETPERVEWFISVVEKVYSEYPAAETGGQTIQECFAHAQKPKGTNL